jgi:hypothetical protein
MREFSESYLQPAVGISADRGLFSYVLIHQLDVPATSRLRPASTVRSSSTRRRTDA